MTTSKNSLIYINSGQNDPDNAGIHIFTLDTDSGALHLQEKVAVIAQCDYLNLHPSRRFLLASASGENPQICSFAIDAKTGNLSLINAQPSDASAACYVAADLSGKFALAVTYANPGGQRGSSYLYPMNEKGELAARSDYRQYKGDSAHEFRQEHSHPHMIAQEPAGNFVVIPDLGTDRLMLHSLNEDGTLAGDDYIGVPAGAGPRHVAFKAPYLYVINELDSTVNAFVFDMDAGKYVDLQVISTLPEDGEAGIVPRPLDPVSGGAVHPGGTGKMGRINRPADLNVHPSGNFLYGSNRGHNSIVAYRIADDGTLALIGHTPSQGDWPRAFYIDPTGTLLICANQWSDDVFTFWIDAETGALSPTGYSVQVSRPSCVRCLDLADIQ